MSKSINICLGQINFMVGDIEGNADKIIAASQTASAERADLIIFPELALTGYSPEDLLLRKALYKRVKQAIDNIRAATATETIHIVFGYPYQDAQGRFNKALCLYHGEIVADYAKQCLPNYSVFDERRYFNVGNSASLIEIKGIVCAIIVCEDLWQEGPLPQAKACGAELVLCINASPFAYDKAEKRRHIIKQRAQETELPLVYLNLVGGQDELVFDGGSMLCNRTGEVLYQAGFFVEATPVIACNYADDLTLQQTISIEPLRLPQPIERIYQALVLAVRDYVRKNRFQDVILGLSGGIDSALTLAIAVDALGKEHVSVLMMPSRYTAAISIEDANAQAELLGVKHHLLSIEAMLDAYLKTLKSALAFNSAVTEQNLQSRIRGALLMAFSNEQGSLVLSTGNRSELAVGYSTLYGDMVGAFCVLKDIPKQMVYQLANYRNGISQAIPQRVIDRPPSAELAAEQTDQDDLPPYPLLDEIIERYVNRGESYETIIAAGIDAQIADRVICLINRNEYKRRQAPIGVRINEKAFGKDRRYPITSAY